MIQKCVVIKPYYCIMTTAEAFNFRFDFGVTYIVSLPHNTRRERLPSVPDVKSSLVSDHLH